MEESLDSIRGQEQDLIKAAERKVAYETKDMPKKGDSLSDALNLLNHLEDQKGKLERRERTKEVRKPSERLADSISSFGGSWTFIVIFLSFMAVWVLINITWIVLRWDPYPFILLNLILSTLAAIQAPIILMSQNRQASRDRYRDQIDFERDRLDLRVDTLAAKTIHEATVRISRMEEQLVTIERKIDCLSSGIAASKKGHVGNAHKDRAARKWAGKTLPGPKRIRR